jgi:hypothetical protein
MTNRLFISAIILIASLLNHACKREEIWTDSSAKLNFSTDTLSFDTVFTTIGSATKQMLIYNRSNKPIRVSSVKLQGGTNSFFKINVDGISGIEANNIDIQANDSAYIQVIVDPTNQNTPLEILDSIIFNLNGNIQNIKLLAFGQDVHLYKTKESFSTIKANTSWINDKPYLIYDTLYIDSTALLTIQEGVTIYMHKNASIIADGNIEINGTFEKQVVFRGDRLDKIGYTTPIQYDKVPSQWGSIWLRNSSTANKFTYTEIRNGVIGLQVGVLNQTGKANVALNNVIIQNNSYAGIFAINSKIKAHNTLIANNGYCNFFAATGGEYEFIHTTFASYANFRSGNPSVVLTNKIKYNDTTTYYGDLKTAYFGNCIIWGTYAVEYTAIEDSKYAFNYVFDKCHIKDDNNTINTQDQTHFKNITRSGDKDPGFVSIEEYKYNFRLKKIKGSKLINAGNIDIATPYPTDFDNHNRLNDDAPDLGAFEYIP